MIDFVVRYCGERDGYLPIIQVAIDGRELYRGNRHPTREAAFAKMMEVWDNSETGNITEYKAIEEIA
jgi:hypothetical protein